MIKMKKFRKNTTALKIKLINSNITKKKKNNLK